METLHKARLVFGCIVLCNRDGPCCVLVPCKRYPEKGREAQPPTSFDPVKHRRELERKHLYRKKNPWWASKKARKSRKEIDS